MATSFVRVPRAVGFGAGLFALALVVYTAAGAAWGLTRPELTGHAVDGGGYAIDTVADIQFASFVGFVGITAVLSAFLGAWGYVRGEAARGIGMHAWVGVVALAASAAFFVAGSITATHMPANPGDVVSFVPALQPGIGWVAAPFMAMLAYWAAAFISADSDWD